VSLNESANQLKVSLDIFKRDSNNNIIERSQLLEVDLIEAYLSGAGTYNDYRLGFRPVADVLRIVAEVEANSVPVVRGVVPGTSDNLGDDSIIKIKTVSQGETLYVEDVDYKLINQSQIDWSVTSVGEEGREPAPGTTYYVSFIYTQPLAKDIDYKLNTNTDSIEFIGNTPGTNLNFTVDYSYYLGVGGVLYLDYKGDILYSLGNPAVNPVSPSVEEDVLVLATFKLFLDRVEIVNKECKVIKFKEINQIVNQVNTNVNLLGELELDNKATSIAYQEIQDLPLGLFTDSLKSLKKIDIENSTATISVASQGITAGYLHKDVGLKYVEGGVINNNLYITLPFSSTSFKSNERATKTRRVKASPNYIKAGRMNLSCNQMFLNKNIKVLNPCDYLANITSLLARISNNKTKLLSDVSQNNQSLFSSIADKIVSSIRNGVPANFTNDNNSNTFLNFISSQPRASNIEIEVRVSGLKPKSDGYELFFSGQKIPDFTLLENTQLSLTTFGTLKASDRGEIAVKFDLLSKNLKGDIRVGTHLIELKSSVSQGYAASNFYVNNNLATQIVISALRNWNIEYSSNVTEKFNIPFHVENEAFSQSEYQNYYDSINQVFTVLDYTYLTSIDLKLKSMDINYPLVVKVRTASLFSPEFDIYSLGYTNNYNPSNSGLIRTRFNLLNPILLSPGKKYCISLESLGEGFEIFTSELGEEDLFTGGKVGSQIFNSDTLYLSEDGKSLNASDKEDINYQLNKAIFPIDTSEEINLGTYGVSDGFSFITSFCLNLRDIIIPSTSIIYKYKIDDNEWVDFSPNQVYCLSSEGQRLYIKAILSSSNVNLSPAIISKGASISLYQNNKSSYITSKIVDYKEEYNNITINFEYVENNNNIKVYYNNGQNDLWYALTKDAASIKAIDEGNKIFSSSWKGVVNQNNLNPSTQFRYKIEFTNQDSAVSSTTLRNIISYVY
jgi:hypothetical protein